MTPLRPAVLLLALGLTTLAATLSQCGDRATAASPAGQDATAQEPAPRRLAPAPGEDCVRLLVSGDMQGRLEPCGCSSGQLGGLPRRRQHIAERRNYDLLLEGGNLVEGTTELDLLKASTALMALFQMQQPYDALGIGPVDLELPIDEYVPMLQGLATGVVASDLDCSREDWPGLPFVEKTVRGHTVRIASFTRRLPAAAADGDGPFRLLSPTDAWQRALDGADDSTLRVLMLHDDDTAVRKLVPTLEPRPDLVVCFDHSYSEPPGHPEMVAGVPVVYPGIRGRILLDLSLRRGADGPQLGYDAVPLPSSKTMPGGGGDPDARQILLEHRNYVAETGVLQRMAEQRPTANGADYVGNVGCMGCHQSAMKSWRQTAHGHAWKTLVDAEKDPKRYGWPVTKYPDCVGCHVIGYGEQTGYVDAMRSKALQDVGCERCHGAGSRHVENPTEYKLGLIGGVEPSMLCVQCHDFEQSPDFLYGDKWPLIEHGREPHMPAKKQ